MISCIIMNEAPRDQRRGVTAPERYVPSSHELSVCQIFLSCLQLSVTELTPCSSVLVWKLTVPQPVRKFRTLYGT